MKKILVFIVALSAFACGHKQEMTAIDGTALGTYYSIKYFDNENRNFQPQIDSLFHAFNQSVSLWEKGSVINRVNDNEDVELDAFFIDIFNKSQEISAITDGAFDVTVGALVRVYGFGNAERSPEEIRKIDSLLMYVNYKNVHIEDKHLYKFHKNTQLDFNAIAKGYCVDLVGRFLQERGVENYLVDIGGEVLAKGIKPNGDLWIIGIEKPAENAAAEQQVQQRLSLTDCAVATSGNYRKYYEFEGRRYAHCISPKTGEPVRHNVLSVTVLAKECWRADAYATAFLVMGLNESLKILEQHPELGAYFIYADDQKGRQQYSTYATENLKALEME